jgi:lysophospholipase L1-like esterase
VVLITSGGNDFLRRVPEDQTRRHLQAVVERVRAAGATPVVFGIPAPGLAAAAGIAVDHALYARLAENGAAHLIGGVVAAVLADEALRSDRIHPNRAGYAAMAQAAREVLDRCR